MTRNGMLSLAVPIATAALFACMQGEQRSGSADSTARNLTLAPTESTAAMRDVPVPATEPVKPAVTKKKASKPPTPPPAAPTTLTAAAGTQMSLAASDTITTRAAKVGDSFTATVSQDVKDASGRVVIPAGSTVEGTITAARPAPNPNSSGQLVLEVKSVSVRGASYPLEATVESKDTVMKGRGVTKADAAKVGGGAVAGAIVGKLLGKNTKGAVVGGAVGAAAGAAAARASRDIDVVIPKGAAITIKLTQPVRVKAS
jgi:hypothetical protein